MVNRSGIVFPPFFDVTVRTVLNNWMSYLMDNKSGSGCDTSSFESTGPNYIDFRDLFLPAATAASYGASGTSPYGDLFRTVLGFVEDLLFAVDPDTGLSVMNDALLAPLTESQSGTPGSVMFEGDLVGGGQRLKVGGLDADIQFCISHARIENMDTIGAPLDLLNPNENEPYILDNSATMGVLSERPLRFWCQAFDFFGR